MNQSVSSVNFLVRAAKPGDIPAVFEMKRKLQTAHAAEFSLRATTKDWLRDGFGPDARFMAFVADSGSMLVGMITCSERYYTGWAGSTLWIQDMFVETDWRRRGIGKMLLARAAIHALERECPLIELTVRKDNPARRLYKRSGFDRVGNCETYVAAAEAMTILAGAFPQTKLGSSKLERVPHGKNRKGIPVGGGM